MAINRYQSRAHVRNRGERIREDFEHRKELLRERLTQPDFLANKGIGNEIGFYTFCYDPSLEFECRAYIRELESDAAAGKLPCTLKVVNLYDALLDIAEKRHILKMIPKRELVTGSQAQIKELRGPCGASAFAKYLVEQTSPLEPGDVVVLTGVGEVYPVLRVHDLLSNVAGKFVSAPVVIFYPGTFDGTRLRLFNSPEADGYYRAFDIS